MPWAPKIVVVYHGWLAAHRAGARQAARGGARGRAPPVPPAGLPPLCAGGQHPADPLVLHDVALAPVSDGDLAKLETLVLRSMWGQGDFVLRHCAGPHDLPGDACALLAHHLDGAGGTMPVSDPSLRGGSAASAPGGQHVGPCPPHAPLFGLVP